MREVRRPEAGGRRLGGASALDLTPDLAIAELTAKDVTGAVLRESRRSSVGSAQYFIVALRGFLRFCFVEGLVRSDLSALHRLGLRAGEVAGLTLEDIDWRAAEIVVHGKGRRRTTRLCSSG